MVNGTLTDSSQINQYSTPINNLERGNPWWGGTASGAVNVLTVAITPIQATLYAGQIVRLIPNITNTGAATLTVTGSSAGAVAIKRLGATLAASAMLAGVVYTLIYDGTVWHLQ